MNNIDPIERIRIAAMLAKAVKPEYDFDRESVNYDRWAKKLLKMADALIENGKDSTPNPYPFKTEPAPLRDVINQFSKNGKD